MNYLDMDINPQLCMVMAERTVVCLADVMTILEKEKKGMNVKLSPQKRWVPTNTPKRRFR